MIFRIPFISCIFILSGCKAFTSAPEAKEAKFSSMSICHNLADNGLCQLDESELIGTKKISVSIYFSRTQSLEEMTLRLMNGDKEVQHSPIIIVNKNESAYSFISDTNFPRGKYTVALEVSGKGYDDFKTTKDFAIASNVSVEKIFLCQSPNANTKHCTAGINSVPVGVTDLYATVFFTNKTVDEQWFLWFRPSSVNLTKDVTVANQYNNRTLGSAISAAQRTQKIALPKALPAGSYEVLVMQSVIGQTKESQIFKQDLTVK